MRTNPSVDEVLHVLEQKAGMLRYLANLAATTDEHPDPVTMWGINETCRDLEEAARDVRHSLDAISRERPVRRRG